SDFWSVNFISSGSVHYLAKQFKNGDEIVAPIIKEDLPKGLWEDEDEDEDGVKESRKDDDEPSYFAEYEIARAKKIILAKNEELHAAEEGLSGLKEIRVNDAKANPPHFITGLMGRDNSIARHGIHGLYWLYNVDVLGTQLVEGDNIIFLTQPRSTSPFQGLMYDYIHFEKPPTSSPVKKCCIKGMFFAFVN
ncbi:hypothetical protein GIB67_015050, partial [Kingdonia uniflora]